MSTMHSLLAATILAMAGCNSVASGNNDAPGTGRAASGGTVADGSTFDMRPGQSVTLADGSALRYERLVNESRCMPDVQCVWAGDAEVAFTWKPINGPAEAFSLHTGKEPRRHALGERTVILVTLARGAAPEAQLRIEHHGAMVDPLR